MNLRKHKARRFSRIAFLAAIGLFAFASSAAAVVFIYTNGFNNRSGYREIDQVGGGDKCDKDFLEEATAMRIEVSGREFCEYAPPVTGDKDQPNHEIIADGRLLSDTPRDVRLKSYLAVRVRVGSGSYYELRVYPKDKRYKISREPGGGAFPLKGESEAIEKLGEDNLMRLRVTGNKLTAFVNGEELEPAGAPIPVDPQPGEVDGRKLSFGIGSTKKTEDGPIGIFKSVRVGIPNP
jgi:hypothetical protein